MNSSHLIFLNFQKCYYLQLDLLCRCLKYYSTKWALFVDWKLFHNFRLIDSIFRVDLHYQFKLKNLQQTFLILLLFFQIHFVNLHNHLNHLIKMFYYLKHFCFYQLRYLFQVFILMPYLGVLTNLNLYMICYIVWILI